MDRLLLLSRLPLPIPTHAVAGADGDLLELDVFWSANPSAVGLGLLAALPEDEGKKKKRATAGDGGGFSLSESQRCAGGFPFPTNPAPPPETSKSKRSMHSGAGVDLDGAPTWPPGAEAGPISFTIDDFSLGAQAKAAGVEDDRDCVKA